MEDKLSTVNSDLINLIESQLLETELYVKDDEDVTMADDLLDLALDTTSLCPSTQSNSASRVPYKKMRDSSTSNSQLSPELCCKDQIRSNNNSALLDGTCSPNHDNPPPLEMVWDNDAAPTSLPDELLKRTSWSAKLTEGRIMLYRGTEDCTTCKLCQQHFSSHRRLRVHIPQHYLTTFCPCGEYSYHRDYILRHQRIMKCHTGHIFDVDQHNYTFFLSLIKPFIKDPARYERLQQGFPSPRPITSGPCTQPTWYKESPKASKPSSPPTLPPRSIPRVLLQRIDVPRKRGSPSPPPQQLAPKWRWLSSSPNRHSLPARNLKEVETRICELEQEVLRLAPRVTAVNSELQALRSSVATLKRGSSD